MKESLSLGQRLSDSLALQAMLENGKRDLTGEGMARAEELLRAAITPTPPIPAPTSN